MKQIEKIHACVSICVCMCFLPLSLCACWLSFDCNLSILDTVSSQQMHTHLHTIQCYSSVWLTSMPVISDSQTDTQEKKHTIRQTTTKEDKRREQTHAHHVHQAYKQTEDRCMCMSGCTSLLLLLFSLSFHHCHQSGYHHHHYCHYYHQQTTKQSSTTIHSYLSAYLSASVCLFVPHTNHITALFTACVV